MSNLLALTPLLITQPTAEVYVVYNNTDYRMTLATLVSLVTKASLQLGNVNNTSDQEKPVSDQTAAALDQKANKLEVPTLTAFTALANSLQNYVSIDTLNAAIDIITTSLSNYATKIELQESISTAIAPIATSMQEYLVRLQTVEQTMANAVSATAMQQAINAAVQVVQGNVNALNQTVDSIAVNLSQQISAINTTLTAITQTLAQKAPLVHTHVLGDIPGLEDSIRDMLGGVEGNVLLGPDQW